jgi:hypothetical protein
MRTASSGAHRTPLPLAPTVSSGSRVDRAVPYVFADSATHGGRAVHGRQPRVLGPVPINDREPSALDRLKVVGWGSRLPALTSLTKTSPYPRPRWLCLGGAASRGLGMRLYDGKAAGSLPLMRPEGRWRLFVTVTAAKRWDAAGGAMPRFPSAGVDCGQG